MVARPGRRSGVVRRRSLRAWWVDAFTFGIGTPRALGLGIVMIIVSVIALAPEREPVSRATQALTLVVPVVIVAVLGGRRAAYAVAGAATVAFSLVEPPVGSVRVRLTGDLVALAVFLLVAVVVGTVVARRIELLGHVERHRSALLRSVSHDLRTPLAAIQAAASELASGELPRPTAQRFVELIGDESRRLDRLVSNLLSLSRIEAGAYAPVRQLVDLAELVESAVDRLGRLFTTVHLGVRLPDDLPMINADHTQLDQLITNLLENAARHSPVGGTVTVEARAGTDELLLMVSDEGPGVDTTEVATLFEPFRSGRVPGAGGIGLAICKAVVDGHGGTISVGESPTHGAVFTVAIPLG